MKKYIGNTPVTILLIALLWSCSKSNGPTDYASFIKDKTWWGTLTHTGQEMEYYSIHFNSDSSMIWDEALVSLPGHWHVDGKKLTISFQPSSLEITADISDDKKLINIEDNSGNYEINSGQIIENPNIALENSVWKGTVMLGTQQPAEMDFNANNKVVLTTGTTAYPENPYSRSASGGGVTN
jgi:hypothetical protein